MIRLVLVRHAKSDWADAALADHDRPLNARGLRDAPVMARLLADTGFRPAVILSSTAVRARTTAEAFGAALRTAVACDRALYGAPPQTILQKAAATGASDVLVVAHNPGLSILAAELSGGRITHLPTCAVASFAWDEDDWSVIDAVDPREWSLETPAGS